jgi:hypothetical protein
MGVREDAITRVVSEAKANPKGGEAKALLEVLGPDEIPERAVKGFLGSGNGLLVATDRRAIFVDKGLVGLRVEEFPYNKITSIQYKTGFALGEIAIHVAGNAALIKNVDKATTRGFGEWLRTRITASTASAAPAPQPDDPMAQLAKVADLHKQGILTDEEFAAKKKQLLGL